MVTHLCHSSATPPKQQSLESLGRSSLTSKWSQRGEGRPERLSLISNIWFGEAWWLSSTILGGHLQNDKFSKVCLSSRFCQNEVRKLRLYRNYFQLVFFLGKIRSGRTNSAVLQTASQKFTFLRLCPLVGFRPTSLGSPPNYSLSLRLTTRKLYE